MISKPGDNRTALIAALIAIPASCLVTMIVHTFVPIQGSQQAASFAPRQHSREFPEKGPRKEFDPAKKEAMLKKFAEARKERMETLKKIEILSAKRLELLKKDPRTPKCALINAQTDCLLARGAVIRAAEKIRIAGTPFSDTAVKAAAAEQISAFCKTAAGKKGKNCEAAALKNEINALQLQLQLKSNRLSRNPGWQAAYKAFLAKPDARQLTAMYLAEAENQPQRRGRH